MEWLIEQGVKFSGMVDDYLGSGIVSCFHWFEGDVASVGYVPHMTARAEELGVDVRLETSAKQLIMSDGKVAGLFAEDSDGNTLQINAKACLLYTSGSARSRDDKLFEHKVFRFVQSHRPAQDRFDAHAQLVSVERLHEVIVTA